MNVRGNRGPTRRHVQVAATVGVIALLAVACSGGSGGDGGQASGDDEANAPASTSEDVLDNPRWATVVRGPQARDTEPTQGGSIVVGLESEANSYLPSEFSGGLDSFNVAYAIFDPLVTRDESGELRPYLAESIEPNDDFTEWTLRLRPGVRFHDGTPLDAQALKRMFDDYLTVEGTATQVALENVQSVEVVDELTVTYVMRRPDEAFPALLELPAGWPFSPTGADRLGEDFGAQPVGTGPYRLVRWQRDDELVVERNTDYWQDGQPYVDEITFRIIPDEATRAASLQSGDVDAIRGGGLSPFVADLADIEGVQVALGAGSNRSTGIWFNTARPPTDDVRVRQALAHAADQEALLQVAAGEAAELTEQRTQFFPEDSPFYSQAVVDASLDHDPETAQDLLADYIDDPDRSDGKAVGEPVSITVDTSSAGIEAELGMAYERFYEDVGFDVTVQLLDRSTLVSTLLESDFQAHVTNGFGRGLSPLGEFQFYFGDPDEVVTNFSDFHDQTVTSVLERLRTAGTVDEQAELTEEMGRHLAQQVPLQWIGGNLELIATNDDVHGIRGWTFPDGTLGDGVSPSVTFWGQVWRATNR